MFNFFKKSAAGFDWSTKEKTSCLLASEHTSTKYFQFIIDIKKIFSYSVTYDIKFLQSI